MKSIISINKSGYAEYLVVLDDRGETQYLKSAIDKLDRLPAGQAGYGDTVFSPIVTALEISDIHGISITRAMAWSMWKHLNNQLAPRIFNLPAHMRRDPSYVIGSSVNALNSLYSHSVNISGRLCRWRKRKARVPAMFFDGSRRSFNDAVRFTDLSPMFGAYNYDEEGEDFLVPTLEGEQTVTCDSYLVRGPQGEFYPVLAETMDELRVEVTDEIPFEELPYVRYWENIQTPVDAITFDEAGTALIHHHIDSVLAEPHTVEFPRKGVIELITETRDYVGHFGDVAVFQQTGDKASVRFVRDDIFRNTYETTPDLIKGVEEL